MIFNYLNTKIVNHIQRKFLFMLFVLMTNNDYQRSEIVPNFL